MTGEFPEQRASARKMFPFHDVIMKMSWYFHSVMTTRRNNHNSWFIKEIAKRFKRGYWANNCHRIDGFRGHITHAFKHAFQKTIKGGTLIDIDRFVYLTWFKRSVDQYTWKKQACKKPQWLIHWGPNKWLSIRRREDIFQCIFIFHFYSFIYLFVYLYMLKFVTTWPRTGDTPQCEPITVWFIEAYMCHSASVN